MGSPLRGNVLLENKCDNPLDLVEAARSVLSPALVMPQLPAFSRAATRSKRISTLLIVSWLSLEGVAAIEVIPLSSDPRATGRL